MTFSIVGFDRESGLVGVAVSTAVPCVGALCPFVAPGVGAIATQSYVNPLLGSKGLDLMAHGISPESAITALLAEDPGAPLRQVGAVDVRGRTFVYSGDQCVDWYGGRPGEGYTVQGNMLVGKQVLEAMAEAYQKTRGPLWERLLAALEAGQDAGGDKRGRRSAALKCTLPAGTPYHLDIRVDDHPDPVVELRRIYQVVRETLADEVREAERRTE